MSRASVILPLLSFWTLILLLSCSQQISDEEAKRMVRLSAAYPQPVFNMVHAGYTGSQDIPKFIRGVEKLAEEGYVAEETIGPEKAKTDKTYVPTERSRGVMNAVYIRGAFVIYDGAVCNEVLKKIEEVDFDKKSGTATIRYVTGYVPIEPFYSLLCLNEYCEYFGEKLKREETRTARLRKTGNGWKPIAS